MRPYTIWSFRHNLSEERSLLGFWRSDASHRLVRLESFGCLLDSVWSLGIDFDSVWVQVSLVELEFNVVGLDFGFVGLPMSQLDFAFIGTLSPRTPHSNSLTESRHDWDAWPMVCIFGMIAQQFTVGVTLVLSVRVPYYEIRSDLYRPIWCTWIPIYHNS